MTTPKPGIAFLLLATILFSSMPVEAQEDQSPRFAIGARTAFSATGNSKLDHVDAFFETAGVYGFDLTYLFFNRVSLELSGGFSNTDMEIEFDSRRTGVGSVNRRFILLTAAYHEETTTKNLTLYAGGGIGFYFNDFDSQGKQEDETADFFALNRTVTDIDNSIEFHGNVGSEYFFRENLSFIVDLKFSFSQPSATLRNPDSTTEEVDLTLNTFIAGLGLKYYLF